MFEASKSKRKASGFDRLFGGPRPPRSVTIFGVKVAIKMVEHLEMADGTELIGAYNDKSKTIFLSKDPKYNWRTVLLHEMVHAALALSGAGSALSTRQEEAIVDAIEYGFGPCLF